MSEKGESQDLENSAPDVVATICQPGVVAVPAKPSTAMLAAGADAGQVSVESAWRIYLAMVRAAG